MLSIQDRMPTWRFSMPPTMQIALEPAGLSKPFGLPVNQNHEYSCIRVVNNDVVNWVWLFVRPWCANIVKLHYDSRKVSNHQFDALTNALCHGSRLCGVPSPPSRRAEFQRKLDFERNEQLLISFEVSFANLRASFRAWILARGELKSELNSSSPRADNTLNLSSKQAKFTS